MNIILLVRNLHPKLKESLSITTINHALELKTKHNNVYVVTSAKNDCDKKINDVHIHNSAFFSRVPLIKNCSLTANIDSLFSGFYGIKKIKKLTGNKIDLVHSFSAAPIFALRGLILKLFFKTKYVHTLKSQSYLSKNKFSLGGYSFSRVLNCCDAVTVQTKKMAEEIISHGCKKEKVHVIRSHIDLEKFKPKNKDQLKKKYGFKDKKVILYYGYFGENKGLSYLLKAAPLVLKKNPDTKIILISRWEKYPKFYDKLIETLGIKKQVLIITKDVIIEDYVNLADMVVLPYPNLVSTESNPSCILESLACKTPVVTTNLSEIRELVTHKKEAILAKPKDVFSLAENINLLFSSKKLQTIITNNGFKRAKDFGIKKIVSEFSKVYEKVLSNK
ncbi:MAG: glycosyltransferase [Nanoarchaeota archaeon]|nr:glycosyltransferase [Nanoarchaeota archaeon]